MEIAISLSLGLIIFLNFLVIHIRLDNIQAHLNKIKDKSNE